MTLPAPSAEHAARALTDRIKVAVEGTWLLIQEAYTTRAWAALGYETWDAYLDAEFRNTRLALPREERAETVQSMRQAGMSLRAISAATGVSPATVMRDARVSNETPAEITGIDGRTYAAARPAQTTADLLTGDDWTEPDEPDDLVSLAGLETVTPTVTVRADPEPAPEPAKPKRRPLPEVLAEAARDYIRAAEKLARLTEDNRFPRNRDTTHHQLSDLVRALEDTAKFLTATHPAQAAASEEARRWWATSLHKTSDALTDVAHSLEQEHR